MAILLCSQAPAEIDLLFQSHIGQNNVGRKAIAEELMIGEVQQITPKSWQPVLYMKQSNLA